MNPQRARTIAWLTVIGATILLSTIALFTLNSAPQQQAPQPGIVLTPAPSTAPRSTPPVSQTAPGTQQQTIPISDPVPAGPVSDDDDDDGDDDDDDDYARFMRRPVEDAGESSSGSGGPYQEPDSYDGAHYRYQPHDGYPYPAWGYDD